MSNAIVLLSGGLDSSTTLAIAKRDHAVCYALFFAYGQRHSAELAASRHIASHLGAEHHVVTLDDRFFSTSALVDKQQKIAKAGQSSGIPTTYVPARNLIFLSMAVAWGETLGVRDIYIGVNAVDYSGYPDCRPQFISDFERVAVSATRTGSEGGCFRIRTPLMHLSKAEIIKRGIDLGIDYATTVSCYQANEKGEACGDCEACDFRCRGFAGAGVKDPTRYFI